MASSRSSVFTTLIFTLLALSGRAWADRIWVEVVRGGSVSDSDRESVEELIKIAVPEGGKHSVVSKPAESDWTLSPSLMKLGDAYVLGLQKKDKSGKVVFSDKMKAASMSEMDTVASRLTRAVLSQTAVEATADVTNITEQEEKSGTRRFQATRHWVIGIGPGWTGNLRSSGGGFTWLLGFLWGVDPHYAINLSGTFNSGPKNDESSFSDFSLGADYLFSRARHTPFVGARLGYGSARMNHDGCNLISLGCSQDRASGWSGTVNAGWRFFRTSTVNAGLVATYSLLFDKTSAGSPSLATLQIAVYF